MPLRVVKIQLGTESGGKFQENPTAFERCVESVSKRGGARSPAGVCAAAGRKKYGKKKFAKMAAAGRKRAAKKRTHNPLTLAVVQAADGAGEQSGRTWPAGRKLSSSGMGAEFRAWLAYRSNSLPDLRDLTRGEKLQLRGAFFRGVRRGFSRRNPRTSKKKTLKGRRK